MNANELSAARDAVWQELSSSRVRRSMLGRDRCDALVRVALEQLPTDQLMAAGRNTESEAELRRRTEDRVKAAYSERCGFVFMSLIIYWAISTIVQILVVRWWNNNHPEVPK